MHVDMDAFFAAFEIRNLPVLKGKPVIIGGDPRFRSVVTTCSYEARRFGVHSGMPVAEAKRLCPEGIYISGTLGGYVYTSALLQKIFREFSPVVEPFSVDEAFLDITGCHRIFGNVENLVSQMKKMIREKISLTCSVGIAPYKIMAKMASSENKPDGLTIMDRADFRRIFSPRPVSSLWGIGEATEKMMNKRGIRTVADLAAWREKKLRAFFGKNGEWYYCLSRGKDESKVYSYEDRPEEKSMSHETTLGDDIYRIDKIYATLLWLADKVSRRLRQDDFMGKTVGVKIRSSDFKTITRERTLARPTDQARVIYQTARKLVPREYGPGIKVRLLGVRVSRLEKTQAERQLSLIDDRTGEKLSLTSMAVDRLRERYGDRIIKYAGAE